jgi:hypothetical protein
VKTKYIIGFINSKGGLKAATFHGKEKASNTKDARKKTIALSKANPGKTVLVLRTTGSKLYKGGKPKH